MPVSIRLVLSLGIALVTFIAATIAFAPTYLAGVDGVRSAVRDLRAANLARTQSLTQAFFDRTSRLVSGAIDLTAAGVLDWTITDPVNKAKWYKYMWSLMVNNPTSIKAVAVTQLLKQNPAWNDIFFIFGDSRFSRGALAIEPNTTAGFDLLQARFAPAWPYVNGTVNYTPYPNQTLTPLFPFLIQTVTNWMEIQQYGNTNTTFRWTSAAIGAIGTPQLGILGFMRDSSNTLMGTIGITVDAVTIGTLLGSLGLRSRSRAFCVDVNTGIIIGTSWKEALAVPTQYIRNTSYPTWMRVKVKAVGNMTDSLVSEAVRMMTETTLLNAPTPLLQTINAQHGRTYVDAIEVNAPGLHVRIVLVIPEADFLEQIQSTQAKTIGGIAGAVVLLILLAFILGHVVTGPFIRLRDRMYMTATFQDDGTVDPPSLLTEVSEMQASYELMRSELAKVKSYLPQSVLVTLYGGGNSEDEEDEEQSAVADKSMRQESVKNTEDREGSTSRGSSAKDAKYHNDSKERSASFSESDRRSTRSSARSASAAAGAIPKVLNTATNLTAKKVTVAVFNLRGFHAFCGRSTSAEITTGHSHALEVIDKYIAENKGVIDFFHGDRLQASFNAVSHCAGHAKRGAVAALQVVKEFSKNATMLHATAGVSSGMAHVGNMGTTSMKRFCILGPVVPQAVLLERMTRMFPGVSVLCPSMMFAELGLELFLQSVAITRLPGALKAKVVASVEGIKKMATDEWMYELQQGESGDPYAVINQFFEAAAEGEKAKARELFGKVVGAPREHPLAGEIEATRLVEALQRDDPSPFMDCGPFYDKCLAPE